VVAVRRTPLTVSVPASIAGEEGYFRIARGSGKCGINTAVTTGVLAPATGNPRINAFDPVALKLNETSTQ